MFGEQNFRLLTYKKNVNNIVTAAVFKKRKEMSISNICFKYLIKRGCNLSFCAYCLIKIDRRFT